VTRIEEEVPVGQQFRPKPKLEGSGENASVRSNHRRETASPTLEMDGGFDDFSCKTSYHLTISGSF
jgi:hypothetical protein